MLTIYYQARHIYYIFRFTFQIETLSGAGGPDVKATTRRVLYLLLSTGLALELNWFGRGKKDGLIKYQLANVMKRKSTYIICTLPSLIIAIA